MLVPGPKQSFLAATIPLTTPGNIGFIKNCLGAKAILIRVSNVGSGNTVTNSALPSIDGINDSVGFGLTVTGSGVGNGAGGLCSIITFSGSTTQPFTEIPVPWVRLKSAITVAQTTGDFEVWPLFEINHPNLSGTLALLPS